MINSEDHKVESIEECRWRDDWDKLIKAIESELNSRKLKVFGLVIHTPKNVKPFGCKWIFMGRPNEKVELWHIKHNLSLSQKLGIGYDDIYSHLVNT